MPLHRRLLRGLNLLLRRRALTRQLEEELQLHVELEAAALERERGMSPDAARAAALRAFGGMARYRDETRDAGGLRMLDDLVRDVRWGVRSMLRQPSFTAIVIVTLGLGVGATSAVFSALDQIILRPLPYADPDRIVALWHFDGTSGEARREVAAGNFLDWRERTSAFSQLAVAEPYGLDWVGPDGPVYVETALVSEGFFEALGTQMQLGRALLPQEHEDGAQVVVLSDGFWRRRFGGDSALIGQTLVLDGAPWTVVGVMPRGAEFPSDVELWAPKTWRAADRESRRATYFTAIGRLREGVTLESARSELDRVAGQLAAEHPATNANVGVRAVPLEEHVTGDVRTALIVLFGAVVLVLLIACVNVANLLLANAVRRQREFALRTVLGASGARVARQLLVESLVLGCAGAVAGVLIAWAGVFAIRTLAPTDLPRVGTLTLDGQALAFTLAIALVTSVIFGLAPVLALLRGDVRGSAEWQTRSASAGRGKRRVNRVLVAAEVSMALVLVIGAGLLLRSLDSILGVDPGFETKGIGVFTAQTWSYYPTGDHRKAYVREVLQRLASLPGVSHAGVTSSLPLTAPIGAERAQLSLPERVEVPEEQSAAHVSVATQGYFEALGISLMAGRMFEDESMAPEVVVSEGLARRLWPGENPVGRTVTFAFFGPPAAREVVGVVRDVRHDGPHTIPRATVYVPFEQAPTGAVHFVVRGAGDVASLQSWGTRELHAVNGAMPLVQVTTMRKLVDASLRERRFHLALIGSFATAALILAAVGLYGVMSHAVGARVKEMGIRMAVGARGADVMQLVLREGLLLAGIGALLGVLGAAAMTRVLQAQLHGVKPLDPTTFGASVALLLTVAILATAIPAYRAARADPLSALRSD